MEEKRDSIRNSEEHHQHYEPATIGSKPARRGTQQHPERGNGQGPCSTAAIGTGTPLCPICLPVVPRAVLQVLLRSS